MTIFVSVRAVPQCLQGTGITLGCAGLLTVATMSWTNFELDSDFKWLLFAPAVVWLLGLVSYRARRRAEHAFVAGPLTNVDAPK